MLGSAILLLFFLFLFFFFFNSVMPPTVTRCTILLLMIAWACMCFVFVMVTPLLPAPTPPISISYRPPPHASQLAQGHTQATLMDSRAWAWQSWRQRADHKQMQTGRGHYDERNELPDDLADDYDENYDMADAHGINDDLGDDDDDEGGVNGGKIKDKEGHFHEEHPEGGVNDKRKKKDPETGTVGEDERRENYHYYEDLKLEEEDSQYTGSQYNVTPPGARLLIYNRIPKCASSTMQTVLKWCSTKLGYQHVSSQVYDQRQLSKEQRNKLVQILTTTNITSATSTSSSLSYDRHLYYIDFPAEGAERPVYINLMREPVERFISSFYYRRSKNRLVRILALGKITGMPSALWINRTVEQCLMSGDPECSFTPGTKHEMVYTYFCGHQEFCRTVGSKAALQVAKQVVAKKYSVVGLVEHMETSLSLMQTLIPGFLTGALDNYRKISSKKKVNKNRHKPNVSKKAWQELRRRLAQEIDFYNFLNQRLFLQAKAFLGE